MERRGGNRGEDKRKEKKRKGEQASIGGGKGFRAAGMYAVLPKWWPSDPVTRL